jgi:hypothetical protein
LFGYLEGLTAHSDASRKKFSTFLKRIKDYSDKPYSVELTEMLARLVGQSVTFNLKENGVADSFLADAKYTSAVYMTFAGLKRVVLCF